MENVSSDKCKECVARLSCLADGTKCNAVKLVMEMVLGDYLGMLEEQDPAATGLSEEETSLFRETFKLGCVIICERFGINWKTLDVDRLLQ